MDEDLKRLELKVRIYNAQLSGLHKALLAKYGECAAVDAASDAVSDTATLAALLCSMQSEPIKTMTAEQHNAHPKGRWT